MQPILSRFWILAGSYPFSKGIPRFVRRMCAAVWVATTLWIACPLAQAHYPLGATYYVFQFPSDKLPTIDGDPSDWKIVPRRYTIDGSHLWETVRKLGRRMDPKDLWVEVTLGWSPKTNRLYFLYKMYDDVHNYRRKGGDLHGDIFEVVIDADHSGGRYHSFEHVDAKTEARLKSTTCQNYHIFTPPAPGRPWAWVWGSQQWLVQKPYAKAAFRYDFGYDESGVLYLEFYITPFDYASYLGPAYSAVHKMQEGERFGLSWAVLDYDKSATRYDGFWNLSHHTRMDRTADLLPDFVLMPLEKPVHRPNPSRASHEAGASRAAARRADEH